MSGEGWGGGEGDAREILGVNTGFNKLTQSLIVWSCHTSCTLPSAGLKENKLQRCKFNKKGSWKMVRFFPKVLFPSNHRLTEKKKGGGSNLRKNMEYTAARLLSRSGNGEPRQHHGGWFVWRSKLCPKHGYL